MSEYLAMKKQLEELQAKIEGVRLAEIDAEIADIKQRIAAFGIRPEQLFTPDDLKALDGRSTGLACDEMAAIPGPHSLGLERRSRRLLLNPDVPLGKAHRLQPADLRFCLPSLHLAEGPSDRG